MIQGLILTLRFMHANEFFLGGDDIVYLCLLLIKLENASKNEKDHGCAAEPPSECYTGSKA